MVTDLTADVDRSAFPPETELLFGNDAVLNVVTAADVDTIVSAVVGAAGLEGTWAALEAGKRVALANKETLVVAGPLVMALAKRTGACLLPVDSEHSAIFQALVGSTSEEIAKIVLTASGGPFRGKSATELVAKKERNRKKENDRAQPHQIVGGGAGAGAGAGFFFSAAATSAASTTSASSG